MDFNDEDGPVGQFLKRTVDNLMSKGVIVAGIRTGAAVAGTAILAWIAATLGVEIPQDTELWLQGLLFAVGTGLFNLIVVWLQKRVHPWFGWLLLVPKAPEYDPEGESRLYEEVINDLNAELDQRQALIQALTRGQE